MRINIIIVGQKAADSTNTTIVAGVDISDTCRSISCPFSLPLPTTSDIGSGSEEGDDSNSDNEDNSCGSNTEPPPPQKKARTTTPEVIQEGLQKNERSSSGSGSGSSSKKNPTKMTLTKRKSDGKTIVNNFYF